MQDSGIKFIVDVLSQQCKIVCVQVSSITVMLAPRMIVHHTCIWLWAVLDIHLAFFPPSMQWLFGLLQTGCSGRPYSGEQS